MHAYGQKSLLLFLLNADLDDFVPIPLEHDLPGFFEIDPCTRPLSTSCCQDLPSYFASFLLEFPQPEDQSVVVGKVEDQHCLWL